MNDLSRLCVHTITTKPWPIETAIEEYAQAGVRGMTVWRDALIGRKAKEIGRRIHDAGMEVVSLCRGGFFASSDPKGRAKAIEDNLAAIDEAAALGAPHVVLVCGADPTQPLGVSRDQIEAGIAAIHQRARDSGVKLAIEPLHPMYADSRSAVNTLEQANDMCDRLNLPGVGVAVDVYHVFWDPHLEAEIHRCGASGRLLAFHVCDWRTPTRDFLNDRGLMGEGCIRISDIRRMVDATGFRGFCEVEIFSNHYWKMDQGEFLSRIVDAFREFV